MTYPDSTNLPFNFGALRDGFAAVKPGEPDSGELGIWIVFRGNELVLNAGDGVSFIEGKLPEWCGISSTGILIGTWKCVPVRILEMETGTEVPAGYLAEPLLLTFFQARLADDLLTLAGLAQQILCWDRKSRVCSLCGGGMERIPGTWGKKCLGCGHEHFPHIHPCAIVLVRREDELLLIRKPEWPSGYYSIPSGFCDFGESLEECARREVEEETGIRIRNLRYVGSQSWPFPGQLMIGFIAEYSGGEIVVERSELEDAAWFRSDAMPPTFSGGSIAGWIMENFGK
jgi:NAD+ diphosphatase